MGKNGIVCVCGVFGGVAALCHEPLYQRELYVCIEIVCQYELFEIYFFFSARDQTYNQGKYFILFGPQKKRIFNLYFNN